MNKINLKFIIQNDLINQEHKCYSDLLSIINGESTITAANEIVKKLEKKVEKLNKKINDLNDLEKEKLEKKVEKLNKKINDLNDLIQKEEKAKIRKNYIKDLDWSESKRTIKPLMPGLYYYDKTYIACFPKIFKNNQKELESNQEKSKEYFCIIFSTIIKYLKYKNKNQNKSVPEYDDLSYELFDNFYFPGIIDEILDSYARHKLVFPLRKHENVNNWLNIHWNKTIARSSIFLINNDFPIFDKVISHNLNEDKEHIVAKIHAMILNEIFDEFSWLFYRYIPFIPDLKETLLKEQTPYYLKILKEERSKTNIEWKKETINFLINYLEEKYLGSPNARHWLASGDEVFNQIWQKACQVVYGNHLDDKIGNYQLLNNIYSQKNEIKNIFEKIEISSTNRNLNNINPDQILIFDKAKKIFILDAKNYKSFEDTNTEIYKQYVYSFYFPKVLSKIKNTRIFNCFLIPHADEPKNDKWNIIDWRKVELPFFHNKSNYKDLNILWKFEISMIKTFEYYLENKEIDLSDFHPENLEKIKDKK